MNVWIINHYAIPPSMGGLVRHYYFSKFLRQMGHTVRIFTASEIHNTNINMIRDSSLYKEQEMDGVPYTFLKTRDYSGNGLSRIYNMLEFPLRIQQAVKKFVKNGERPDVIYTSAPTIFAAASALVAARRLKVPCVVEVRDIWPESIVEYKGMSRKNPIILALYQLEKWLYKKADRLIFTMEGGKDYIREKHWEDKVPLEKIYNLNNGVDLQEYDKNCQQYRLDDPDLLDESTFKVVYTGSIRLVNNLGKIVEMAEYLQKQGENKIKFLLRTVNGLRAIQRIHYTPTYSRNTFKKCLAVMEYEPGTSRLVHQMFRSNMPDTGHHCQSNTINLFFFGAIHFR